MRVLLLGLAFLGLEAILICVLAINMIKKRKFIEKSDAFYIVPVYMLVFIMYIFALIYSNLISHTTTSIIDVLALAKTSLEAFVLTFDIAILLPIMSASPIMVMAYSIMFILTSLTTIFAVSILIINMFKNFLNKSKAIKNNGDIIFGLSEDSKKYNKLNPTSIIWDDKISNSKYKDLISKNYVVYNERLFEKTLNQKIKKGNHHLILFKDSPYSYSKILELFENVIQLKNVKLDKKLAKKQRLLEKRIFKQYATLSETELKNKIEEETEKLFAKFKKIKTETAIYLHIESSVEEMDAIKQELSGYSGTEINSYVQCFNKYQNMALDFVKQYPISYYVPKDFYNKNFSLKENKKINIVFVGFGNVNLELFKMMAMNFHFAKEKTTKSNLSKFKVEPINYYCYDNSDDKLCNDTFTKLDYEFTNDTKNSKLLPMERICNLNHQRLNVYSSEIKQNIEKLLNEDSYTYIVVSLKSDLENISYAENLQGYLSGEQNFKIFTRVKEDVFYEKTNSKKTITYFGKENELFAHDIITNKKLITLAQSIKSAHAEKLDAEETYKWYNLPLMQQYSKIYLALSMFFKIGLMGYKLIPANEVTDKTICDIREVISNYSHKTKEQMNKDYNCFFENNASNLMAFIEHSRWNAHHYLSGYKPMKIEEFAPTQNKPMGALKIQGIIKKHSSLTSYDGLDVLVKYIYLMKKYGKDYCNYSIKNITNEELNSKEFMVLEQYSYDFRVLEFIQNLANGNYIITK